MRIKYKKIPVYTYYLQAKNMPQKKPSESLGLSYKKIINPDLDEYLKVYNQIGEKWGWAGHNNVSRKKLKQILLSDDHFLFYFLYKEKTIGLIEFLLKTQSVELLYFGLIPEYTGKGFGKSLMQLSFFLASQIPKAILELHTCEFDHKNALSFYQKQGFKIIKNQIDFEFYSEEFIQKNFTMTTNKKLALIRQMMKKEKIDAYVITGSDPHISEYVPARWETRAWTSGFTGSAGRVVITQEFAGLWTDSRYFIQAENQLANSDFQLMKLIVPHTPEYITWLQQNLKTGQIVATDGNLISDGEGNLLTKSLYEINCKLLFDKDFVSPLWENRPEFPLSKIMILEEKYTGKSVSQKLSELRTILQEKKLDYFIVSALDELAWLFNIRSNDIQYNPVAIAYALISSDKATLYIKTEKLNIETQILLQEKAVTLKEYNEIGTDLAQLPKGISVGFSPTSMNMYLKNQISEKVNCSSLISPINELKAQKNETEIKYMKKAHIKDGVALTQFFMWLEKSLGKETLTEYTLGETLHNFRAQQEHFVDDSFAPIVGFNGNGAIIHYSAEKDSAAEITQNGILLIDSGGQYLGGTTDITRTTALGDFPQKAKTDFTLVLKGFIQLALAKFPNGTAGYQLDTLARFSMWKHGKNYGHGTGHGVGAFLNVHEGPQAIRHQAYANYPMKAGMITSNEPGIYPENEYGIRIENLILCKESPFDNFLEFENITMYPIDLKLIKKEMLNKDEIEYLNKYHKTVYQNLSIFLTKEEKDWLKEKTKKI